MIIFDSPSVVRLEGLDSQYDQIKKFLTYRSVSASFMTQRFKKARWYINKHGREAFEEKLQEYKDAEKKCLLWEDGGNLYTYSGLAERLAFEFKTTIINDIKLPDKEILPWHKEPDFKLRDYQLLALKNLAKRTHANVSLPTGSGKSACILFLVKDIGLKTVVMAPSVSIATQLFNLFSTHLGTRYVGMFGNGKKKTDKLITIAIAKSLTNVKEGTPEWENLSQTQLFVADESHLCPAETLRKVCMGIFGNSPYRYFFSATQMRADGADLLLDGIIGDNVLTLTEADLIDKGYLAKPSFLFVKFKSEWFVPTVDPTRFLINNFYNNPDLHKKVAEMANSNVEFLNQKVLIMIDKVVQFKYLYPYLRHHAELAYSGADNDALDGIPEKFHNKKAQDLVDAFNRGEISILVGTPCIAVGTDIKPVDVIYNLQSGKSEVKFKQLIGRGTRTTATKTEFFFVDFDLYNMDILHRHFLMRKRIYEDFYNNCRYIDL